MKCKLVGATRRSGQFKPQGENNVIKYDKLVLYLLEELEDVYEDDYNEVGFACQIMNTKKTSIRWKDIPNKLDIEIRDIDDLFPYLNTEIDVEFDINGIHYVHLTK